MNCKICGFDFSDYPNDTEPRDIHYPICDDCLEELGFEWDDDAKDFLPDKVKRLFSESAPDMRHAVSDLLTALAVTFEEAAYSVGELSAETCKALVELDSGKDKFRIWTMLLSGEFEIRLRKLINTAYIRGVMDAEPKK